VPPMASVAHQRFQIHKQKLPPNQSNRAMKVSMISDRTDIIKGMFPGAIASAPALGGLQGEAPTGAGPVSFSRGPPERLAPLQPGVDGVIARRSATYEVAQRPDGIALCPPSCRSPVRARDPTRC
jgi:hypothetical protein